MKTANFTPEALRISTDKQREMIAGLFDGHTGVVKITVTVDFSLPEGYVYVVMESYNRPPIHGGIDPEGSMST